MNYTTLLLGASLLLISCKSDSITVQAVEKTIRYHEKVSITPENPATLTFAEVEDSRCPENVQCVWAGNAIVDLQLRSEQANQEAQAVKMCLGDCNSLYPKTGFREADTAQVSVAGTQYTLILTNASPYPNSTKTVKKEDYTIKLKIQ